MLRIWNCFYTSAFTQVSTLPQERRTQQSTVPEGAEEQAESLLVRHVSWCMCFPYVSVCVCVCVCSSVRQRVWWQAPRKAKSHVCLCVLCLSCLGDHVSNVGLVADVPPSLATARNCRRFDLILYLCAWVCKCDDVEEMAARHYCAEECSNTGLNWLWKCLQFAWVEVCVYVPSCMVQEEV